MKRVLGGLLVVVACSVTAVAAAEVDAHAGVSVAGPGCPSKPGVCAPESSDPGHDAGNILA